MSEERRARFGSLLAQARPDVAEVNLLIAAEANPDVDIAGTLAAVDALARDARSRGGDVDAVVTALRAAGLRGDRDDYDDPDNSFLDRVLARGRGLPILLSALTIAVADRLGLRVGGVGLPGHFVVVDHEGDEPRYLDPFDGWAVLGRDRLAEIVLTFAGEELDEAHLAPVPAAAMARRMLVNLRGSYLARGRLRDVLWTLDLEELAAPADPWVRVQRRAALMRLADEDAAGLTARFRLN